MQQEKSKSALIADDHHLYRSGLSLLLKGQLGFAQVFEAATLDEALDFLEKNPEIDLALFDLAMPGMSGSSCLAEVRALYPNTKLAVVSASEEKADVLTAIEGGLNGFMPKTLSNDQIAVALRDILGGRIFIPSLVTSAKPRLEKSAKPGSPLREASDVSEQRRRKDGLTPRQKEVFELVCQGLTNKEIGERLGISEGTIKVHISAMLAILRLRHRTEFLSLK